MEYIVLIDKHPLNEEEQAFTAWGPYSESEAQLIADSVSRHPSFLSVVSVVRLVGGIGGSLHK